MSRFDEFIDKLVYVSYRKPERSIVGKLIFEDDLIIKIETLSQIIAIAVDEVNLLQLHRKPKRYEGTMGGEVE